MTETYEGAWWEESLPQAAAALGGINPIEVRTQAETRKLIQAAVLIASGTLALDPAHEKQWRSTMTKLKSWAACYWLGHDHMRGRELAAWRLATDFFKEGGPIGERLLHTLRLLLCGVLILDQRNFIDVFEERPDVGLWTIAIGGIHNLQALSTYPSTDDEYADMAQHFVVPDEEFYAAAKEKQLMVMYGRTDVPEWSAN